MRNEAGFLLFLWIVFFLIVVGLTFTPATLPNSAPVADEVKSSTCDNNLPAFKVEPRTVIYHEDHFK